MHIGGLNVVQVGSSFRVVFDKIIPVNNSGIIFSYLSSSTLHACNIVIYCTNCMFGNEKWKNSQGNWDRFILNLNCEIYVFSS